MEFTIKIDQQLIKTNADETIMEACRFAGLVIPRFCYHELLPVAGNCRMCIVELAHDDKKLHVACITPVEAHFEVYLNSFLTKKVRETILELLLINHPLDCPICDQGGECDLQEQTNFFGLESSKFGLQKKYVIDKNLNIFIKTIMNRCIHCTRCIRFSTDLAGVESFGMINRGLHSEISNFKSDQLFFSEISGNVVDLCPVGALTSKHYSFKARPWELKIAETVDITDDYGSPIYVTYKQSVIHRILPKYSYSKLNNLITDKTRFSFDFYSHNRLLDVKNEKKVVSWSFVLNNLKYFLLNKKENKFSFLLGNSIGLENLHSLKYLFGSSNNVSFFTLVDSFFYKNFYFSYFESLNSAFENSQVCFLFSTNIKLENALLNYRLRYKYLNEYFFVYSFGFKYNSNFEVSFINLNIKFILKMLEGKSQKFSKLLITSKNPIFLIGENFKLRINDFNKFSSLIMKINFSSKYFFINKYINNEAFYFLNTKIISKKQLINSNLLFFINLDESLYLKKILFFTRNFENKVSVWMHSHLPTFNFNFTYFLPLTTFFEEKNIFLNIERIPVYTKKIGMPISQAKNLQLLIKFILKKFYNNKKIIENFEQSFSFLNFLKEKVNFSFENTNSFFSKFFYFTAFSEYNTIFLKYPFKVLVQDFYLTNNISKNSQNMQKASAEYRVFFKNFK